MFKQKLSFLNTLLAKLSYYSAHLYRKKNLVIFIILLTALVLRVYKITQPFNDMFDWRQSSTAMMAENFYKANPNIFYPEVNWTGPGPSYQGREFQTITYITALIYRITGQQDWVGRMVAVVFGIWGIYALYKLTSLIWDKKHGLASALLMTLLTASIFIERSFLPDPAMVSLVVTSFWLLAVYLQTYRRLYLVLASFIGCLGFLTKIPGLVVGLPMLYATIAILKSQNQLTVQRLKPIIIAGILIMLPVIGYYLWARHLSLTYPPFHFAGEGGWIWDNGIKAWMKEGFFLDQSSDLLIKSFWGWPVIVLVTVGLCKAPSNINGYTAPSEKGVKPYAARFTFHYWLFGCCFFYFIGARELISNPWNFHIFSPAIAALAARGLVVITSFRNKNSFAATARLFCLLCIILISDFFQLKYTYYYPYADNDYYMGLALNKIKKPGDLVVVLGATIHDPLAIYYSRCRGWLFPPFGEKTGDMLAEDDQVSIDQLELLRKKGAAWFGIAKEQYREFPQHHPLFQKYLNDHYKVAMKQDRFIIYDLKSTPAGSNGKASAKSTTLVSQF